MRCAFAPQHHWQPCRGQLPLQRRITCGRCVALSVDLVNVAADAARSSLGAGSLAFSLQSGAGAAGVGLAGIATLSVAGLSSDSAAHHTAEHLTDTTGNGGAPPSPPRRRGRGDGRGDGDKRRRSRQPGDSSVTLWDTAVVAVLAAATSCVLLILREDTLACAFSVAAFAMLRSLSPSFTLLLIACIALFEAKKHLLPLLLADPPRQNGSPSKSRATKR